MKKSYSVMLCSLVFSILIIPLTVNPAVEAIAASSPVPIPGNLFPKPSNLSTTIQGSLNIPITPSTSVSPSTVSTLVISSNYSITKMQSGLIASDPLNKTQSQGQLLANTGYWTFGGDAPAEKAQYNVNEDKNGLHIGVKAPHNGVWAGFYAASPNTNATLFHAVINTPVRTIPHQYYENGLYVQTSQPSINYVTCVSVTSSYGTIWAVVSTTGNADQATQFNVLWTDASANQPLTRDCTIITNGQNYLKVYLDNTMVYSNSTMNLQMPAPFNAYLEPQTSFADKLLKGTYKNYYTTSDENIQVINNPINAATVKLVSSTGVVLESAPVILGTATLSVGQYHMPLAAYIKVCDFNSTQIASTSGTVSIFGGDIYSVNTS